MEGAVEWEGGMSTSKTPRLKSGINHFLPRPLGEDSSHGHTSMPESPCERRSLITTERSLPNFTYEIFKASSTIPYAHRNSELTLLGVAKGDYCMITKSLWLFGFILQIYCGLTFFSGVSKLLSNLLISTTLTVCLNVGSKTQKRKHRFCKCHIITVIICNVLTFSLACQCFLRQGKYLC